MKKKGSKVLEKSNPTNRISCGVTVAKEVKKNSFSISSFPTIFNCLSTHQSLDTLHISLWLDWFHPQFLLDLEESKSVAHQLDEDTSPISFAGQNWSMHRTAPKYYRYHISSGDIHIFLSLHKSDGRIANCKVEIGSLSCWSGSETCFNSIKEMLTTHGCKVVKELVSRADLCLDLVGVNIQNLDIQHQDYWINKANTFGAFYTHHKLTGIQFGKGHLSGIIYDKVRELTDQKATTKQEEFAKIWGIKNYDEQNVTRVEYRVRRKVLAQFADKKYQIDTVEELHNHLQSLWDYCTQSWSRHCEDYVDRANKHQSRSVFSSFWKKVSAVDWTGIRFLKRTIKKVRTNIGALKDQLRGIAITLASSTGLDHSDYFNIQSVVSHMLSDSLHDYMTERYSEFRRKFKQRQVQCITAVNY